MSITIHSALFDTHDVVEPKLTFRISYHIIDSKIFAPKFTFSILIKEREPLKDVDQNIQTIFWNFLVLLCV